jgi:hypothetical protein
VAATLENLTVKDLQIAEVAHPAMTVRHAAIKAMLTDLWPKSMIALGLLLTVIWTCGLAWLLLALLAFF